MRGLSPEWRFQRYGPRWPLGRTILDVDKFGTFPESPDPTFMKKFNYPTGSSSKNGSPLPNVSSKKKTASKRRGSKMPQPKAVAAVLPVDSYEAWLGKQVALYLSQEKPGVKRR